MVLNLDGIEVEEYRPPQHDYETALILGTLDGRPVVVKTFAYHPPVFRWLLGWLCRREARLLRALEPVGRGPDGRPWLPVGARVWRRWGVLMPRLEGRPLKEVAAGELPEGFIARLEDAVARLHAERIVHLDLKNSRNILLGEGGRPVLLDFAGCLSFRRWPLVGGALTRLFGRIDHSAVLRWKREYFPGTLTAADRALLARVERLRRWWPFPVRRLYRRETPREIVPGDGGKAEGGAVSPHRSQR